MFGWVHLLVKTGFRKSTGIQFDYIFGSFWKAAKALPTSFVYNGFPKFQGL